MNEEDYKDVIETYQKKAFELFNQNIVLETQVNSLTKTIESLTSQSNQETLKSENEEIKY
jgi:hypothetical protein